MKTLIFLDDERFVGQAYWISDLRKYEHVMHIRSAFQFIEFIDRLYLEKEEYSIDNVVFSFDHDLQSFKDGIEYTGYTCAKYLVDKIISTDTPEDINRVEYFVHSKNPIGAQNICGFIENAKKFFH